MPRRDTLASKHKCLTPINKTGTCRIATKVGTQKDRTREFRDRPSPPSLPSVAVPHPRERPVRPLPAGASLHARARAQVARQVSARAVTAMDRAPLDVGGPGTRSVEQCFLEPSDKLARWCSRAIAPDNCQWLPVRRVRFDGLPAFVQLDRPTVSAITAPRSPRGLSALWWSHAQFDARPRS